VAGVLFGALWTFVRGVDLTVDAVLPQLLTGVLIGLPVAFLFRRLYDEGIDIGDTLTSIPYAVLYVLVFAREVVVANVDVTYRVLSPAMPIEPEVMYVPLRVQTDIGVTTIANSITLTPGTITLDHDPDENALYVHVIDGRDPDQIVEPIRTWENYALRMFDETLSPDDPAPPIRMTPDDAPPDPKDVPPTIDALDMGRGPPTDDDGAVRDTPGHDSDDDPEGGVDDGR
jgi:multicomponent Na+:H+ antiporter subunit E